MKTEGEQKTKRQNRRKQGRKEDRRQQLHTKLKEQTERKTGRGVKEGCGVSLEKKKTGGPGKTEVKCKVGVWDRKKTQREKCLQFTENRNKTTQCRDIGVKLEGVTEEVKFRVND